MRATNGSAKYQQKEHSQNGCALFGYNPSRFNKTTASKDFRPCASATSLISSPQMSGGLNGIIVSFSAVMTIHFLHFNS